LGEFQVYLRQLKWKDFIHNTQFIEENCKMDFYFSPYPVEVHILQDCVIMTSCHLMESAGIIAEDKIFNMSRIF
jgi:hypothetical protein